MAAGDFDVKVRFRSYLPGAGHSSTGAAKANKTLVSGTVDFEYATGGIAVSPADLGLDTLEFLSCSQIKANTTVVGTAALPIYATYNAVAGGSGNIIIVMKAATEATNALAGSLSFLAFGDSALAPELT